jgi:hypothetical protein
MLLSLWLQESESEEEAAALVAARPREPPRWVHATRLPVPLPEHAAGLECWRLWQFFVCLSEAAH